MYLKPMHGKCCQVCHAFTDTFQRCGDEHDYYSYSTVYTVERNLVTYQGRNCVVWTVDVRHPGP